MAGQPPISCNHVDEGHVPGMRLASAAGPILRDLNGLVPPVAEKEVFSMASIQSGRMIATIRSAKDVGTQGIREPGCLVQSNYVGLLLGFATVSVFCLFMPMLVLLPALGQMPAQPEAAGRHSFSVKAHDRTPLVALRPFALPNCSSGRPSSYVAYGDSGPLLGHRCRLIVLATETSGRWSHETVQFIRLLADARAASPHPTVDRHPHRRCHGPVGTILHQHAPCEPAAPPDLRAS